MTKDTYVEWFLNELQPGQLEKLLELYSVDFELFDYDPKKYYSFIKTS